MKTIIGGDNLIPAIQWLSGLTLEKSKRYAVEVKEHREKRSLNANNYMWLLCGKLADSMGLDNSEVYRDHIRHMGIYKDVEISENAVDTLITSWGMHGIGWIAERLDAGENGFVTIRLYYGSSTYNSKQMARLIDGIVQDCQAVDIETKTPQELASLCERWEPRT